jgi:asparagine synthase (glutamine-hydrolysing)
MCGIGAIFSKDGEAIKQTDLNLMINLLHHRGPDGNGSAMLNHHKLGFAHTRLAINDQAHGHQPMYEDEAELTLSYNGEIYDCDHLRSRLRSRGFQFKTRTDTEVILKLYQAFGTDMFKHMNGEFAFLLWDNKNKKLIAGRDRFGIKPLLYYQSETEIAFASEAKALIALNRLKHNVSSSYLLSSFMGNFIGQESLFDGVQPVKPGHFLVIDDQSVKEICYWQSNFTQKTPLSFNEAKEELNYRITQAVERRLVADTEVGSYLSGGIDSTIITSIAAQKKPNLKAFSVGFDGAEFDESTLATRTADELKISCSPLMTNKKEMANVLIDSLRHSEIPISSPQPTGMTLLSEHINQSGIKACLTGDGADELFAGYAFFKLDQLRQMEQKAGKKTDQLKRLYQQFYDKELSNKVLLWFPCDKWQKHTYHHSNGQDNYISNYAIRYQATEGMRKRLFQDHISQAQTQVTEDTLSFYQKLGDQGLNSIDFNRALSYQQLSQYIFPMQSDRLQMSHSVEGRTPFLDNDVVEFAESLPPEYLIEISKLQEKHILHETFKNQVPQHMRYKHKQAYHAGFSWQDFTQDSNGKEIWQHYLSTENIKQSGVFKPYFVKTLRQINRFARPHSTLKCKTDLLLGNIFTSLIIMDLLKPGNILRDLRKQKFCDVILPK